MLRSWFWHSYHDIKNKELVEAKCENSSSLKINTVFFLNLLNSLRKVICRIRYFVKKTECT